MKQTQIEKEITIQVLQDELTALQLELLKTEERISKVDCENKTLVDRWVQKMNEEAQKMNSENEKQLNPSQGKEDFVELVETKKIKNPCKLPSSNKRVVGSHKGEVNCLAVSPAASTFATGSSDQSIIIHDFLTGVVKMQLQGSLQGVTSIEYSSIDDLLVGSSNDNISRVWSLSSGRIKHTLTGHVGKVNVSKFNMDASKVVSGSHDRTIKIWDLARGYCTRTIFAVSISNDLAIVNGSNGVIASGHLDQALRLWDEKSGDSIRELPNLHSAQITSVQFNEETKEILSLGRDNQIKIVDMKTFAVSKIFKAENFRIGSNFVKAHYSPNGKYIICGSSDGLIYVWNKNCGKVETTLKSHKSAVVSAIWNPIGGSNLVSCDKDGIICLWS